MTNHDWLKSLTSEQLAAMFTSGNSRKLNQRAREVWLNAKHTKEDMARLLDIKSDIERSGEFGLPEKNRLLDLKIECEGLAYEFGKILGGVL